MNSMNMSESRPFENRFHWRMAPLVVLGLVELGVCLQPRGAVTLRTTGLCSFVGGFDDRLRQRQHDYLTYATPSFVTANARSKEQACLLLAEPAIRCDNSALYVTERVRHLTPENTWLR
jgi:hypothetical protein